MIQRRNRQDRARGRGSTHGRDSRAGDRAGPEPTNGRDDVIRIHRRSLAGLDDGLLNHLHRVFSQELQDPHVLPCAAREPFPCFEVGPQLLEAGGQLPAVEHKGMIQRRRPATEDRQVVLGLDDPFAAGVTAWVTGDHAGVGCHFDPIHVRLDRHRLEGPPPRHAVTVRVEPHRLILVHLRRVRHERIEGTRRQGQGRLLVLFEQFPDRLSLACHRMVPLGQGTRPQVRIQLGQVLHPRNRRRPVPLQVVHAVLHIGLLIAPRRHAEPRIEAVVTGQGRIPHLHLTLPTFQDRRGHRRGVVPPDLPGHAAEELKPLDHPGQDRLGSLVGQRHGKAIARVTPRQQQHRDLLTALGQVHVDMAKVCLQPPARRMRQGDERLTLDPTELAHVPPHLVVAPRVAVLIPQTAIELGRRVLLLARGLPVLLQDLLDQPFVRTQLGGRSLRR